MNRDPITLILAGLLLVSVTLTAGLCYWYLVCIRDQQKAQVEVSRINRNKALLQALAAESIEYSKKNPAIVPLLQNFGLRPRGETNSTFRAP